MTPDGYRLADGPPDVDDYLALRARSGLSPKTPEQARAALPGSWAACHVVHAASGATVNLLADPPGRRLYARHGFAETAPGSIGMELRLG